MNFEVILEDLNKVNINKSQINNEANQYDEIFHFLKYSYKYKAHKDADRKAGEIRDFNKLFRFVNNRCDGNLKRTKVKEFCLEWFKKEILSEKQRFNQEIFPKSQKKVKLQIPNLNETDNIKVLDVLMGIFPTENDLEDYIKKLIPGSFGFKYRFKLDSPYFSKDDDEFYIIDSPVMKDKVWKVPIIRGSTWKGMLLKAAREKLKGLIENNNIKEILEYYFSITRIFGTGSKEYREIEEEIKKFIDEKENKDEDLLIKQLIKYALSDLGLNLNIKRDGRRVAEQIFEQITKHNEELCNNGNIFTVKRGRAVFYPTYFEEVSLEVINPHNRNTKAGSSPIYYEVVPSGSEGFVQIVYIPYDAIVLSKEELEKQVELDRRILEGLIRYAIEEIGIGAKTKLGWGKATIIKSSEDNMEGVGDEWWKIRKSKTEKYRNT